MRRRANRLYRCMYPRDLFHTVALAHMFENIESPRDFGSWDSTMYRRDIRFRCRAEAQHVPR